MTTTTTRIQAQNVQTGMTLEDGEGIEWQVLEVRRERGLVILTLDNPMSMVGTTTARLRPGTCVRQIA